MLLSDGCKVLPYLGMKPDSVASTHSLVLIQILGPLKAVLHPQKAPETQRAPPCWAVCAGQETEGIIVRSELQGFYDTLCTALAVRSSLLFQENTQGILGQHS